MSAAERKNKDKAMASRLKAEGDERTSSRCPMCPAIVALPRLPDHIRQHGGGATETKRNDSRK